MAKKQNQRPTTPEEIVSFEKELKKYFLRKLRDKLGENFILESSQGEQVDLTSEEVTDFPDFLRQFLDENDFSSPEKILAYYRDPNNKHLRVEIPLEPLIFPADSKANSAVAYLNVNVSSALSDNEELRHVLNTKTREKHDNLFTLD